MSTPVDFQRGPISVAHRGPAVTRLRIGVVGIGKMGISHPAIASAHPDLEVVSVCDSQPFLLAAVRSQLDIATYRSFDKMLDEAGLNQATP